VITKFDSKTFLYSFQRYIDINIIQCILVIIIVLNMVRFKVTDLYHLMACEYDASRFTIGHFFFLALMVWSHGFANQIQGEGML
jgi:hypothetical protein